MPDIATVLDGTMRKSEQRRLNGRPVRDRVRFDKDDCFIVLYPHGPEGDLYDINLKSFRSGTDYFYWLEHLREKTWFDSSFEQEFATVFMEAWHDTFHKHHFEGRNWNWETGDTGYPAE